MYQYWSINYEKCTTLMSVVNKGKTGGGVYGNCALYSQLFCKSKTVLKQKVILWKVRTPPQKCEKLKRILNIPDYFVIILFVFKTEYLLKGVSFLTTSKSPVFLFPSPFPLCEFWHTLSITGTLCLNFKTRFLTVLDGKQNQGLFYSSGRGVLGRRLCSENGLPSPPAIWLL